MAAAGTERLTCAPDRDGGAGRGYTSAMIKRAIFLLLLSCLLAACGNKGPLVLPDKPQAATAPAPIVPVPAPAAPAPAQAPPESAPQPDPVR